MKSKVLRFKKGDLVKKEFPNVTQTGFIILRMDQDMVVGEEIFYGTIVEVQGDMDAYFAINGERSLWSDMDISLYESDYFDAFFTALDKLEKDHEKTYK